MTKENIDLFFSKLSDVNINFTFDNYWLAMILPILFAGVGAYLGAYLKKSGEINAVNDNLKYLKLQLQQTTKITENIKSEISQRNTEHHIKYSIYHQKRIEVIANMYEKLLDIELYATSYIMQADFDEGETEGFINAKESIHNFLHYANRNMMWVPEELYGKFDSIVRKINGGVFNAFVYISKQKAAQQGVNISAEKTDKAIKVLSEDVPMVKEDILLTIRRMLDPAQ